MWEKLLDGERPNVVEEAFMDYFGRGEFFPKPVNIIEIIRTNRELKYAGQYKPIDREALAREQATPEWQESSDRARKRLAELAGKTRMP